MSLEKLLALRIIIRLTFQYIQQEREKEQRERSQVCKVFTFPWFTLSAHYQEAAMLAETLAIMHKLGF